MNVFVLLLFSPFALNPVASVYGSTPAVTWLLFLWLISMANHIIVLLFKKMFDHNGWGLLIFIVFSAALAASDYFGSLTLSTTSKAIFSTPLQGLTSVAVAFLAVALLYAIAYRFLKSRLYPEEMIRQADSSLRISNWAFLQNFGVMGDWIALEVKLILRHKRTRGIIFVNILLLCYALIFRNGIKNEGAFGTFLFIGLMTTGVFAMNYGQFLFSWQAKHFDFTLTQPTSIRVIVASKYWLVTCMNALLFLCAIPFVYFGWFMLLANVAAVLYNIGINTFIVMNMSMWGAQKIDLTHSGSLNYEGMGASQWLMGIPLFASPYIFYVPFSLMGHPIPGVIAVGAVGLVGFIFRSKLIDLTSRRLWNMRYNIASNFRNE